VMIFGCYVWITAKQYIHGSTNTCTLHVVCKGVVLRTKGLSLLSYDFVGTKVELSNRHRLVSNVRQ
jgi:hypothetical protein